MTSTQTVVVVVVSKDTTSFYIHILKSGQINLLSLSAHEDIIVVKYFQDNILKSPRKETFFTLDVA